MEALAKALSLEIVLARVVKIGGVYAPTYMASTYAGYDKLEAEAFTLELGKARPFGQNQQVNLSPLKAALEHLIRGTEPLVGDQIDGLKLFSVAREIIKHSDAFRLNLPADIENFTKLDKGFVLAEDLADSRWVVEEEGARIIFPNPKVKNGLRAGILIVPTTGDGLV